MNALCHPIECDLGSTINSALKGQHVLQTRSERRNCDKFSRLSFQKQRAHGFEENQRADDVDLEMVLERSDVNFSNILPIVGNSSVRNCWNILAALHRRLICKWLGTALVYKSS